MCRCDCRYVDRTSQRLHDRIAQHIPKSIQNKFIPSRTEEPCQHATATMQNKISTIHSCDSAIGLHLLQNDECANFKGDQQFSILAKARTPFHLATLEATHFTNSSTGRMSSKRICIRTSNCRSIT